jgi:hypothetical protein
MLKLPEKPDSTSPSLENRVLTVTFQSADTTETQFDEMDGRTFHFGQDEQWGSLEVNGLQRVLNSTFPNRAEGFYHSAHGLFLEVKAAHFLPRALAGDRMVCLHCRKTSNPTSSGTWEWRVVRCRPTDQRNNSIRQLLEVVAATFQEHHSETIRFSRLATSDATNLADWADVSRGTFVPGGTKAHLDLHLVGGWIELHVPGAPLRLMFSQLVTERLAQGDWQITLREHGNLQNPTSEVRYTAEFKLDLTAITEFQQADGPSGAWTMSVLPVQPTLLHSADSSHVSKSAGRDPSTNHVAPLPSEPPGEASASEGIWLSQADEWFHLPVPAWASNTARAETRHWRVSTLVPAWGGHLKADLWLDHCGTKELRFLLKASGELTRIQVGLENLMLSAEAHAGFVPASWQPFPALPPFPDPNRARSLPGPLVWVSSDAQGYALSIAPSVAGLATPSPNITHWVRPPSGLVGPVEWAANDPGAGQRISALRGLIPIQRSECTITFNSQGVEATPSGTARFPEATKGSRCLLVRTRDPRLDTEVEIESYQATRVRWRHANPHLDAFFTRIRPEFAATEPSILPEPLSWARERFQDRPPLSVGVLKVLKETFPRIQNHEPALPSQPQSQPLHQFDSPCFRVLWRLAPLRWDVRAGSTLEQVLNHSGLRILPQHLHLREDNRPARLEFLLRPPSPLDPVLSHQTLTVEWDPEGKDSLHGQIALPAAWLADHHREFTPITFPGPPDDLAIAFLGIESTHPNLEENNLVLRGLKYWFELDGLKLGFESADAMALGDGRWWFITPSPTLDLHGDATGKTARADFSLQHAIAPHLQLREHLLGEKAGTLEVEYGDAKLRFHVRTSYQAAGATIDTHPVSLLRAGSYHLAWAGKTPGTQKHAFDGGFQWGSLTRLFLHLTRDRAGRLAATGMAGWQCTTVPPGLTSASGRATLYATHRGVWSRLRLSGKWLKSPPLTGPLRSLVFPRHEFELTSTSPSEVTVKSSLVPWVIAEQALQPTSPVVHSYLGCSWQQGTLQLTGKVLLLPESGDLAGWGEMVESQHVRPAVQLRLLSPTSARWRMDANVSLSNTGPLRITVPSSADSLPDVPPPLPASDSASVASIGSAKFGLTRLDDGSWIICPVRFSQGTLFNDESTKLWVLHGEGEDMVPMEGFLEKLGSRGRGAATLDSKALRRCAEETLSFLRWRKPAVLEHWQPGPQGSSDRIVTWTLVDAPLLNLFSDLESLLAKRSDPPAVTQPDLGLVSRELTTPVEAATGNLPRSNASLSPLQTGVAVDSDGHPYVTANWEAFAPLLHGVLLFTRETPFDLEDPSRAWLVDRSPWLQPGAAFPPHSPAPTAGSTTVLLPPTRWRFACPRPGELQRLEIEAIGTDNPPTGPDQAPSVSPRWSAEVRTPRARVREFIALEPDTGPEGTVRWRLTPPQSSAPGSVAIRVLAGVPNRRQLPAHTPWLLAVAGDPQALPPEVSLALTFHSKHPFTVVLANRPHRSEGPPDQQMLQLLIGNGAFGRTLAIAVIPQSSEVEVRVRGVRLPETAPVVTDWQCLGTALPSENLPEAIHVPNPAFQILPDSQNHNLLPPLPHLIGILRQGRLIAYGPCLLDLGVEFTEDGSDCHWRFQGHWAPPPAGWAGPPDALVAIRPDGSVNSWSQAVAPASPTPPE